MNKIIPHFNLFKTWVVWYPWNVLSREISRHHVNIFNKIIKIPIIIISKYFVWNNFVDPNKRIIIPIALVKGHGL